MNHFISPLKSLIKKKSFLALFLTFYMMNAAFAKSATEDSAASIAKTKSAITQTQAISQPTTEGSFISDSLALVDFYNSTNGANWTQGYYTTEAPNKNWLTKEPLSTWHGVSVNPQNNRVIQLYFDNEGLTGTINSSFNNLSELKTLHLTNIQIDANLSFLSGLKNLNFLELWGSRFFGDMSFLKDLTQLQTIYLGNNYIAGQIPDFFQNFSNLKILNLSGCKIGTEIPSFIGSLNSLISLNLSNCNLKGSVPSNISNLEKLASLDLSYNNIYNLNNLSSSFRNKLGSYFFQGDSFNFTDIEYWLANYTSVPDNIARRFYFQYNIPYHIINENQQKKILVSAGGTLANNTYKWYKDGVLIATIVGDSTFIPTSRGYWSGFYQVEITNSISSKITISTPRFYIYASWFEPPVPSQDILPNIVTHCVNSIIPPTANSIFGVINATSLEPLNFSAAGEYVIHWVYDDKNGDLAFQDQNVRVELTDLPVPDIEDLQPIISNCSATVNIIPTATVNCTKKIVATTTSQLVYNQIGNYTITWHYDDGNGHTATQSQQVSVTDLPLPDLTELPTITEKCSAVITTVPTATNCAGQKIQGTTTDPMSYQSLGTYNISWKFDNGDGNIVYQNQTVIINGDYTPPVPDATNGLPYIVDNCPIMNLTIPTATDACGNKVYGVPDYDLSDGPGIMQDYGTITWTFTDGYGNVSYQYQDWSIWNYDSPVPVKESLPTIIIQQGSDPVLEFPIATSHCNVNIEGVLNSNYDINTPGTYILNWVYYDPNWASIATLQSQVLKVVGNENTPKPNLENLPIIIGECSYDISVIPTATSSTGEIIQGVPSEPIYGDHTNDGDLIIINWTYDDGKGNIYVQSQQILIKTQTPPTPDSPILPTITSNLNDELYSWDYWAMATDACGNAIYGQPDFWDWMQFTSKPGTYTVNWTYVDNYGNVTTQPQTIIITDPNAQIRPSVAELPTISAECSVTVNDIPTAIAADGHTIYGTTSNSISYSEQGNYTITWTYDDGIGNILTQDQLVVIKDISAPIPDVASLPELNSQCMLSEISIPTATDNCSGLIYGVPDKDISNGFEQGTNTLITWAFTDAAGNTSYQTQQIIVNDNIAPVPDNATLPDILGECSATELGYSNTPTATDNCSGIIIGVPDIDITSLYEQGTYQITWTFTDNNGNTSTQNQNVIIKDQTAPVLINILPGDNNGQCLSAVPLPPDASLIAAMYTDNCSEVTASISDIQVSGDNGAGWTVTYIYQVSDAAGNSTYANVVYSGKDNIAPEVFTNDVTVSLDKNGHASITADQINNGSFDNCSAITYALDQTDFSCKDIGLNIVTLTVKDANGNSASAIAIVSVEDNIAPTLIAPADIIKANDKGICGATITNLGSAIATDNCSIDNVTNDAPIYFPVGTTTVTYTATDTYGNISTATQNVTVRDQEAPVPTITTLPSISGQQCSIVVPIPTAVDNCAGTITATTTSSLVFNSIGTFVITWKYDDGNGNFSTQNQTVTVTKDLKAPVPNLATLPTLNGQCSVSVTTYPTATDNCSGLITATTKSALAYTAQGTYTIAWTYTDAAGNVATQNQTVVVNDNQAPVPTIATLPDITGQCSVAITTKPTATDNCKGLITATTANPLTYTAQGTYVITWTYTDGKNTSTQTQTVIVKDNIAPVPTVATLPTMTGQCSVTVTAKPTATDNCKGTITGTTTNPLSYTTQGTYTIVWTYADGNGNTTTQNQTVVVSDNIAPVPTVATLPTITGQCSAAVTTKPTAADNCKGTITATTTSPLTYAAQGTYTVVWTYADGNGNTTIQNQTVIVKDNTLPVVKTKAVSITLNNGVATLTASQVDNLSTDNCGIATRTLSKTTFDCSNIGTNTVTLTVTDVNGNSASAPATITVLGTIPSATIASVPTTTVYTGGVATNLYLGYGAQSTKLQVTAPTTGAPYTYSWTSTNLSLLSATNTAAPVFTPLVGGYYSFTVNVVNKNGCTTTATINICVTDIRVNPALNTNVYICHNGTTMQVTQAQVPTYIKTTTTATDKLGSCTQVACAAPSLVAVAPAEIVTINTKSTVTATPKPTEEDLIVTVMPNPTNNYFSLKMESKIQDFVNIRVMDEYGRVIEAKPKQLPNSSLQIGFNYGSGIYFAEFLQGNRRKVIKLIKAKG